MTPYLKHAESSLLDMIDDIERWRAEGLKPERIAFELKSIERNARNAMVDLRRAIVAGGQDSAPSSSPRFAADPRSSKK